MNRWHTWHIAQIDWYIGSIRSALFGADAVFTCGVHTYLDHISLLLNYKIER